MAKFSSTDRLKYVVDGHSTGANDESLYVRPARIAFVSLCQFSCGSAIVLDSVKELGERLAHLVELEQERVVPVRAVDLGVLGVAAAGVDGVDDLARLVRRIQQVRRDAHGVHRYADAGVRSAETAATAAEIVQIHRLGEQQVGVGVEAAHQLVAVV